MTQTAATWTNFRQLILPSTTPYVLGVVLLERSAVLLLIEAAQPVGLLMTASLLIRRVSKVIKQQFLQFWLVRRISEFKFNAELRQSFLKLLVGCE